MALPAWAQSTLYVSPSGKETGDGSIGHPLSRLASAVEKARTAKGDVTIYLREGKYILDEPLVLTPRDGNDTRRLSIKTYPGEKAVLTGGIPLTLQWEPYKKGILKAKVNGDPVMDMLIADGQIRPAARYPNFDEEAVRFNGTSALATAPERVKRWKNPAGGYLHAMHKSDWGDFHYRITRKNKKGELSLEGGWQNNRRSGLHPDNRMVENIYLHNLGGNAVFFSRYNRHSEVSGSHLTRIGASAICFVGDPDAVRSPSFEYGESVPYEQLDHARGPRSNNYPAQCLVYDNLIHDIGLFEKQITGVELSMCQSITVSHNSIYDTPRAGINVSEGTWGGHTIAYNDVFDTVKETGDHGSFNSWGRDRFWHPNYKTMEAIAAKDRALILADAVQTTVIRNNRTDEHSIVAPVQFGNPSKGDFTVADDSEAIVKGGFRNFETDRFGVVSPRLKAMARTPEMPTPVFHSGDSGNDITHWHGTMIKSLQTLGERSATGMDSERGVYVISVNALGSDLRDYLRPNDAIIRIGTIRKTRTKTATPTTTPHTPASSNS